MLKTRYIQYKTSIKTLPIVIVNQLGLNAARIVHQYYNPQIGWEIAVEEDLKTQIIICDEKKGWISIYK